MNQSDEQNELDNTTATDDQEPIATSSDSGKDPKVGHTPGKAEGVEDPEETGNE